MTTKKNGQNMQLIIFLTIFSCLLITGCGSTHEKVLGSESDWENDQGELPDQVGSADRVNEKAPSANQYIEDYIEVIDKTEYEMPTSQWFMHDDEGQFGYELPSGTLEASAQFVIKLFVQNQNGLKMDRDVRIQLTARDQKFEKSELILDDIIHVGMVTDEEEIYSNQLPDKNNVIYVISMEVLDQQNHVEDTMVSMIYVPSPEINAKLETDKGIFQSNDQVTITLENYGPTIVSIGEFFVIEKKVNDSWKEVPLELRFNDIGILINSNDTYDQTIDINQLSSGEYRVIKTIYADGIDLSTTLAAEFSVE